MPYPLSITIPLPSWFAGALPPSQTVYAGDEEKMSLAIDLARRNCRAGTGGPFGAAVFDMDTHHLVAAGVNVVVAAHFSGAHAEIMAIALAQHRLETHSFSAKKRRCLLATSTEPCAMCLGAIPWSGISRLVCGATDADARAVGFNEGDKPADWIASLEKRGIAVRCGVARSAACQVLQDYAAGGGLIYNGA